MVGQAVAIVAMAKLVAMLNSGALETRERDPLSPLPGGVALTENRGSVSLPCSEDNGVGLPGGAGEFVELQCANRQKIVVGFMVRKAVALMAMAKLVAMSNPRALGRRVRDPLSPPPGGVALAENRGRVSLPRSEDDGVVLDIARWLLWKGATTWRSGPRGAGLEAL